MIELGKTIRVGGTLAPATQRPHQPPQEWKPYKKAVCIHLGAPTSVAATIECVGCNGKKTTRIFPVFACAKHSECLPGFRCTKVNKDAVRETWVRSDGGDPYKLMLCELCRADGLGYQVL